MMDQRRSNNSVSSSTGSTSLLPSSKIMKHLSSNCPSDSEDSDEDSLCSDNTEQEMKPSGRRSNKNNNSENWEVVEGLKGGARCDEKPARKEGYLLKRRKWPLKGWHKRYFVLDNGMFSYAKSVNDIQKGKYHGTVDIGQSVLTINRETRRFDIDADSIYHLKVKGKDQFESWLQKLRHHRLYRQHVYMYGSNHSKAFNSSGLKLNSPVISASSYNMQMHPKLERTPSKVYSYLMESSSLQRCSQDLSQAQGNITKLSNLCDKIMKASAGEPSFHAGLLPPDSTSLHTSSSNPNLFSHECDAWNGKVDGSKLQNDKMMNFMKIANSVVANVKSAFQAIEAEQDRLRDALKKDCGEMNSMQVAELKKQNADLKARLSRIYNEAKPGMHAEALDESSLVSTQGSSSVPSSSQVHEPISRIPQTTSWDSTSLSEFYDAHEYPDSPCGESTEGSEEEDEGEDEESDVSDTEETTETPSVTGELEHLATGRRDKLPMPRADPDVSLWGLLCKNIGKDLSKISMPVTLNEPLNTLQRMTEELEYSELLDKAAETSNPYERMVLVAAFAVSPYASTYYRAASKPFNPLLGETYECIREDKGWRFIAEQVSHHPPCCASYCESKAFIMWQDIRLRTKFWGKSMEIQPIGTVNLHLPKFKDHYKWNKATTCVHNLLGGQRWVDHFGEVLITNDSNGITCKLTFAKSTYWSQKRHEVYGSVLDSSGQQVHQVFGKWNEGFYYGHAPSAKCVWRPGSMPEDYELYYGFTRFAIELNEIDCEQVHLYAPTDTRFRPDQRMLEEGNVSEAEQEKTRLEQLQRSRRKKQEDSGNKYTPMWFMRDEEGNNETYRYTGKYWELRRDPGFASVSLPKLW